MNTACDVVVIGAGAAGMMCAIEAGKRGRRVVILDHAAAAGEKIRISGGGRCNFTNRHTKPENFLSENPHFCKSALSRYTPKDFIALIEKHGIRWHEKTLGQLFCDTSAKDILRMLQDEMDKAQVQLYLSTRILSVTRTENGFTITTDKGNYTAASLVIATGGPSIPKMGATGFGYDVARQFGLALVPTRAALVPLLFDESLLARTKTLAGVAVDPVIVTCNKASFREALLFTHRGLSGPAILQISSFWHDGARIAINLLPDRDIFEELRKARQDKNKTVLHNILGQVLPKRLAEDIAQESGSDLPLTDLSDQRLRAVSERIHRWQVVPVGTEGYRTAEVTAGGVDTAELSSKTMECKKIPGLYFIGEVVDVAGQLGGFNFQWAWSSGWCAGQVV